MNYLKSFILIVIASFIGSIFHNSIAQTNLAMLYILAVVITALRWGKGPSILSAVLSVLLFDVFYVPPQFSLTVADTQYLLAFATLFIVAMVISNLALNAKQQASTARKRESQTLALYHLSRDMLKALETDTLFELVIEQVNRTFEAESAIFMKQDESPHDSNFLRNEADFNALSKSLTLNRETGWNTEIVQEAETLFLPLKTTSATWGAMGIRFRKRELPLAHDQHILLETFVNQIASAIERHHLARETQQITLLRETEKLQTAFLNSISHDLRTPLVSITGSLSSILQNRNIAETDRISLIETAYEEAEKMNQLVGDLLDMARVDSGAMQINRKPVDVKDLIGTVLEKMGKSLDGFELSFRIPPDFPEINIDFVLFMKALTNILDNAVKYSPNRKEIEIEVFQQKENNLTIRIGDRGVGIPESDLNHVFDKFFRVKRMQHSEGTGLGLSVVKGIVESHGGQICAENRENGGTNIFVSIPF